MSNSRIIDPLADEADFKRPRRSNAPAVDLIKLDRLPPHSIEAEQGVLGCCLLSPNDAIGSCVERLKMGADSFYDLRHQALYSALLTMWDGRSPIDLITVQQHLKNAGQLDGVGGLAYLSSLMDGVPSVANLDYYLGILIEKHVLRGLVRSCTQVIGRVHEFQGDVAGLVDEVERDILAVGDCLDSSEGEKSQKDHVREAIDAIQRRGSGQMTGIPTGFDRLDKVTGGLQAGDMVVIGARPSCGKTSYAFQIAMAAAEKGLPVGMFSLEMIGGMINQRAIGTIARVNVQQTTWSEKQYALMAEAAKRLAKLPIHIDDRSGLKMGQIKAKARRWHKKHGIKLLIIDYLTLIRPRSDKVDRQASVAEISNEIKALAKELRIPIIALAQLSRDIEKGKERKPMLSDLRESGQIEQDADLIGFLYKEEPDHDPKDLLVKINLLIAKQRNGALDDIRMVFNKEITRFEEVSPIQDP